MYREKNMLWKRVISGLLFLPVFYLVVWKLPPIYFAVLVALAALTGQFEFYRMVKNRGIRPLVVLGMLLGGLIVILLPGMNGIVFITFSLFLVLIGRLFALRPVEGAIEDISATFLGIFYVALLFGFQIAIRTPPTPNGKQWIVFLYFVIWATDIGAYSIGIPFGKHKLFPKISPKKSVEGLIGGFVAAVAMALLCRVWFMPPMEIGEAAGLGALLAGVGTIGDLVESMLKRSTGVKDSGTIIPGHGGMLDRMDSMLFAAPVLFYYITR